MLILLASLFYMGLTRNISTWAGLVFAGVIASAVYTIIVYFFVLGVNIRRQIESTAFKYLSYPLRLLYPVQK